MKSGKVRAHINRRRCLYTGKDFEAVSASAEINAPEHIIPLSLGGLDGFTVDCVLPSANHRAGNEIDDALGSTLPFLFLRQTYKLKGHGRVIPTIRLEGELIDIGRKVWVDIDADGQLSWGFPADTKSKGRAIDLIGSEDQVRSRLNSILKEIGPKNLSLVTGWGELRDAEDVEIALELADRERGSKFKGRFIFDTHKFHSAFVTFAIKVGLCTGYKVLGPEWAFGPAGIKLRSALFAGGEARRRPGIRGRILPNMPSDLRAVLGLKTDRHVIAVLPSYKGVVAVVSLFGGVLGHAAIEIGAKQLSSFYSAKSGPKPIECVFQIDLTSTDGRPRLTKLRFSDIERDLKAVFSPSVSDGFF
ncbi:hypothetical protein GCM10009416_13260 [Craurococcus roseus]|uniref:HNH endonuclease n=1 Tax=Craurococcus roseus TaxID=77585 RepID=A0ABN1EVY6_9PROT